MKHGALVLYLKDFGKYVHFQKVHRETKEKKFETKIMKQMNM